MLVDYFDVVVMDNGEEDMAVSWNIVVVVDW